MNIMARDLMDEVYAESKKAEYAKPQSRSSPYCAVSWKSYSTAVLRLICQVAFNTQRAPFKDFNRLSTRGRGAAP